MGDIRYMRGPAPRQAKATPPPPYVDPNNVFACEIVDEEPFDPFPFDPETPSSAYVQRPTRWFWTTAAGVETRLVVNPNICEICHKRPHGPTPHHSFTPDRVPEATARRLGWPIPDDQEPLL